MSQYDTYKFNLAMLHSKLYFPPNRHNAGDINKQVIRRHLTMENSLNISFLVTNLFINNL